MIGLTPRQQQVVAEIANGKTNAEISRELGIQPNTVKNIIYVAHIRLGTNGSRFELAAWHIEMLVEEAREEGFERGYRCGYTDGLSTGRRGIREVS